MSNWEESLKNYIPFQERLSEETKSEMFYYIQREAKAKQLLKLWKDFHTMDERDRTMLIKQTQKYLDKRYEK